MVASTLALGEHLFEVRTLVRQRSFAFRWSQRLKRDPSIELPALSRAQLVLPGSRSVRANRAATS